MFGTIGTFTYFWCTNSQFLVKKCCWFWQKICSLLKKITLPLFYACRGLTSLSLSDYCSTVKRFLSLSGFYLRVRKSSDEREPNLSLMKKTTGERNMSFVCLWEQNIAWSLLEAALCFCPKNVLCKESVVVFVSESVARVQHWAHWMSYNKFRNDTINAPA